MQTIDIDIPWAEIERRRARLQAVESFEYLDRVPVTPGIASRYWLREFGRTWSEYTSAPRTMLELQIRAHKWVLENVPGDLLGVDVSPDLFSFYKESYALGCELTCDELTPWIRTHPVRTEADLDRLAAVDPADNRYTQAIRDWIDGMEPHLGEYQFRYADGVVRPLRKRLSLGWGSIGIFTLAADLRGPDIYLDLYEQPEFAHRFLDIVTDQVIGGHQWLRSMGASRESITLTGPSRGTFLVDDSAGALSPHLYREFVYPCIMRVVEALGRPLSIHIDAPADHLLPFYREMGVERFPGFGWETSLEAVREYLGGRAILTGNLSPSLLLQGTPHEVYNAARRVLAILAPCGGLILSEGANMAPGTPIKNMKAMVRAAEDFGMPDSPQHGGRR